MLIYIFIKQNQGLKLKAAYILTYKASCFIDQKYQQKKRDCLLQF